LLIYKKIAFKQEVESIKFQKFRNPTMIRVDEINAQIAKLEAEREDAMLTEKSNVLAHKTIRTMSY